MAFILNYILGGILTMIFFEWARNKYTPSIKTTHLDRIIGIALFPLMILMFIIGYIYFIMKFRK
tara:strand:- start:370 stop:561 length:192 start_codon:yes stop_codon:yes gene_type:complete